MQTDHGSFDFGIFLLFGHANPKMIHTTFLNIYDTYYVEQEIKVKTFSSYYESGLKRKKKRSDSIL